MDIKKPLGETTFDELSPKFGSDDAITREMRERNECLHSGAPRRHPLLSRAQVLAVLGPLLISIEGIHPLVANDSDLYNLGVHDVARALLALPDDAMSPLEESEE
jgi:hypothetical protein